LIVSQLPYSLSFGFDKMGDDYWSTREGETGIEHVRLIGAGGFGEVHEVCILTKDVTNSQMHDKETKQVRGKTQLPNS
jgi:hypothetical protein